MILTYAVENFKGIGSRQEIDFIATHKNEYKDNLHEIDNSQILVNNGLCLIGPNGSGKSHILQSLDALSKMVIDSRQISEIEPFVLNEEWRNKPTTFEVLLYDQFSNEFLNYELKIQNKKVVKERLEVKFNKKNAKTRLVFERVENKVTLGADVKVSEEMINSTIDSGSTLLSYRKGINIEQLKSAGTLLAVIFYFTPDLVKKSGPSFIQHVLCKYKDGLDDDDIDDKNLILNSSTKLLKQYGVRIAKIELAKLNESEINIRFYPEKIGENDLFYSFEEARKFFSEGTFNTIVLVLVSTLMHSYPHILLLDEVDGSVHHKLALELIDLIRFNQKKYKGQFVLTTHDIMLLDNEFRRDSIYTVIRGGNLESKVSRVSDFSIRKDAKLSQKYFMNEFGALPNILKTSKYISLPASE